MNWKKYFSFSILAPFKEMQRIYLSIIAILFLILVWIIFQPQLIQVHILEQSIDDGREKAAQMFKSALDESVAPCEDFYQFACGKWMENNAIPADLSHYNHFREVEDRVQSQMREVLDNLDASSSKAVNTLKTFYRGCMDTGSLELLQSHELRRRIAKIGLANCRIWDSTNCSKWPILHGSEWRREQFNLTVLLAEVRLSRDVNPLFSLYVALDQKDTSRFLLRLDSPDLGMGEGTRDYYLNATLFAQNVDAYKKYARKMIGLLARDSGISLGRGTLAKEVNQMLAFETGIAQIISPEEKGRNISEFYNLRHLSQMPEIFPLIDWGAFFGALIPPDVRDYFATDPQIVVAEPQFFAKLANLLQGTDAKVQANYFLWRYAQSWLLQMDHRFDDARQDFLHVHIGKRTKSARWKDCARFVADRMEYAEGAAYIREHFDEKGKAEALDMVDNLRTAFRQMLTENDWMDAQTRERALKKAEQMSPQIAYPDWLLNDAQLDNYYAQLDLLPEDSFARMVDKVTVWGAHKGLRRLTAPADRNEFGKSSAKVNAYYSAEQNSIKFPAAILQPPFFDPKFPKALNYGAIGAIIGHEITHGFDDTGAQYDASGNLAQWWRPDTEQRFLERKQCVVDQYSGFWVSEANRHLNGLLTQGENIADNGGLRQAYKAYQSFLAKSASEEGRLPGLTQYNSVQLFFISYAHVWCSVTRPERVLQQILTDVHAHSRFRVNGVLANQVEFAHAFNCGAHSPMNPKRKCAVW